MTKNNQKLSKSRMRIKALSYALIYVVLAGLWILLSGIALEIFAGYAAIRGDLEIFKGMLFVLLTGIGLYALLRVWQNDMIALPETESEEGSPPVIGVNVLLPFVYLLGLLLIIACGSYVVYAHLKRIELKKIEQNLSAIATLKSEQINGWLKQHVHYASAAGNGSYLAHSFKTWTQRGKLPPTQMAWVRQRLNALHHPHVYGEVALYDLTGKLYLSTENRSAALSEEGRRLLARAVKAKVPAMGVMHWQVKPDGSRYLSLPMATPLMPSGANGPVVGVLLFELSPQLNILPVIEAWPTPSRTAETIVFVRDGDDVVYLNEQRRRKDSLLSKLNISTNPTMLEAQAVNGQVGFLEGADYRGEPVIGFAVNIPDTDWFMIAEVDKEEVEEPIWKMAANVAAVALLLAVVGGASLFFWWRQKRAKYETEKMKAALQQQMLTKQVDFLSKYANDAMLLFDESANIVEANDRVETMYGYPREKIIGMNVTALRASGDLLGIEAIRKVLIEKKSMLFESIHRRSDGTVFPVEVSLGLIHTDQGLFSQGIVRDISERKQAEQRAARLMNLYHALSETNDAIVRLEDQKALFPLACRIAVELGGMLFAWVGMPDPSGRYLVPIESYGPITAYLEGIQIDLSEGAVEGRDPTAATFGEARVVVVNDVDTESATAIWRERARRHGIRSSVTLPIVRNDKPYAVFTVYSDQANAFDEEFITLLNEIATNLGFALENFDRETLRKQAEVTMRQSEARLRRVAEEAPYPMMVFREDGEVVQINRAWTEITGYAQSDIPTIQVWTERAFGDRAREAQRRIGRLFDMDERVDTGEHLIRCKNGQRRIWHFISSPMGRLPDEQRYIITMATDVTESRKSEDGLRLAATVFESSHSAILITDDKARILAVNPAFTQITGYPEEEVLDRNPSLLQSGRQSKTFYLEFWDTLLKEDGWQGEVWNCRKNGEEYAAWLSVSALRDEYGVIRHYIGIADDITENKEIQKRIEYLAYHDSLTGLPNRMLANDRLEQAIAHAARTKSRVAVMFLDLDDFKAINDTLGHSVGDGMLKAVGDRLRECVRESDTVGRLGGDEFLVMLNDVNEIEDINRVAIHLLQSVNRSYRVAEHDLSISTSIGIAVYPDDGGDRDALLKNADMAMYNAKQSGRNTHRFFTEEMNDYVLEHLLIRNGLSRALENNEFQLHFQPLLELSTGRLIGAEALIRWQHPELGTIPPNRFIQVAEDSGMIIPIGTWVLQEACRQAVKWHAAGWPDLRVAVNISAVQFRRGDIEETVSAALAQSGLPSAFLELELTESILIQDFEKTLEVLMRLGELGVHLSIDDFGTGYSSLSYLRRLPVSKLKIDKSFVREITTREDDAAIALSIITLAHSLKKRVVAEGVETIEQLRFLQRYQCNEIQGYFYSRPLSNEAFDAFLEQGGRPDFLDVMQ